MTLPDWRICFRANKDIRLNAGASSTRTDGLMFKDLDRLNDEGTDAPSGGDGEGEDPGLHNADRCN